MGFGNIGIWQLLIILLIVVVVFGTKKLRNMGGDVGGAVKNFREAMNEDDDKKAPGALDDKSDAGATQSDVHNTASSGKDSADK